MLETPYEQRRARAFCLAGLVAVSVCAGVLVGRYSAVVFPISSVASVPAESQPQPAEHATSQQPVGSLAEHLNLKSPLASDPGKNQTDSDRQRTSDGPQSSTQRPAESQKADQPTQKQSAAVESVERHEQVAEQPEESKVGGATILNRDAGERARDARTMPDHGRNQTLEARPRILGDANPLNSECARRYASFRESDGTYQPYGSAQRKVCPLLH
jgi:hypothetical protein